MPRNHTFLFHARSGFTLTEILISITLMLLLMLAVAQVFQYVGTTVTENRAELDASKKLRTVQTLLERDLSCVTVPMKAPRRFADNEGYLCYIEGRGGHYGNLNLPAAFEDIALDSVTGDPDTTVTDTDDIIMFTARSKSDGEKFRGLVNGQMRESHEAEISWFVRGTTLYRRVLLIVPDADLDNYTQEDELNRLVNNRDPVGFFNRNDVSVHLDPTNSSRVVANTLADLGRRENRFGHWTNNDGTFLFPYALYNDAAWYWLRLPTMSDCTRSATESGINRNYWKAGAQIFSNGTLADQFRIFGKPALNCADFPDGVAPFIDFWHNSYPWVTNPNDDSSKTLSQSSGSLVNYSDENGGLTIATVLNSCPGLFDTRAANSFQKPSNPQPRTEDVVMTNVIGFNVQAWDPEQNAYTDLYSNIGGTTLSGPGNYQANPQYLPGVYDTWTDAYELQPVGVDGYDIGIAVDGINPNDSSEDYMKHVDKWTYPPPYTVPLRGIQVKIRVFDPSTQRIKEATIKADFKID